MCTVTVVEGARQLTREFLSGPFRFAYLPTCRTLNLGN
jgi:hypothetical protein